jgi:thioredoxin-related protein
MLDKITICLFLLPFLSFRALQQTGIHFETKASWKEILYKAKKDNKYVFVDCYATWCAPCKEMERTVFSSEDVGNTLNERFISVRVQFDTASADNPEIKRWYEDAHQMNSAFQVNALPTYLFFSPEGQIIHRDLGLMSPEQFKALAYNSLDTSSQYYTLLKKLGHNDLDSSRLLYLTALAEKLGQDSIMNLAAAELIDRFLDNRSAEGLLTKENLDFIRGHYRSIRSQMKVFNKIRSSRVIVDSLEGKGFVQALADFVISKEEISPVLISNGESGPDWREMFTHISLKYDSLSSVRAITQAKVKWYRKRSDWPHYTENLVVQTQQFLAEKPEPGLSTFLRLNNAAWEIFNRSNDKAELQAAVKWIDIAIPMEPVPSGTMQDTKANLLYKLGKRQQAIQIEKTAVVMSKNEPGMQQTLKKMLRGQNTW